MDNDINKELERIIREVQRIILQGYTSIVELPSVMREIASRNENFFFKNNATARKEVSKLVDEIAGKVDRLILSGVEKTWKKGTNGVESNTKTAFSGTEKGKEALSVIQQVATQASRNKAATAFYNAKRDGLNISDRVWNLSQNSMKEMEIIIQSGIKEGLSADEVQKSIRKYLKEPDRLFRRVKNKETGELELSKAAQQYHPGQGVYRSAYMNAMRLARTELKSANCEAVWQAMQKDPSIVGYRVVLSNNHTSLVKGKRRPLKDICDTLQGEYPKTFRFHGWHPQCRCEMIPILATPKERSDLYDKMFDGKEDEWKPKQVEELPKNFTGWVKDNKERASGWKSLPRFMKENYQAISGLMSDVRGSGEMLERSKISSQVDSLLS